MIKGKGGKEFDLASLDEYTSLKETRCLLTGANRVVLLNAIQELDEKDLIEE